MIHLTLTPPESSILSAAPAGDELAFGRLVEPYRRALTIDSYRMLGSRHDAAAAPHPGRGARSRCWRWPTS